MRILGSLLRLFPRFVSARPATTSSQNRCAGPACRSTTGSGSARPPSSGGLRRSSGQACTS
eukprot:3720495-Alexandrium_andersonii.AAC.1